MKETVFLPDRSPTSRAKLEGIPMMLTSRQLVPSDLVSLTSKGREKWPCFGCGAVPNLRPSALKVGLTTLGSRTLSLTFPSTHQRKSVRESFNNQHGTKKKPRKNPTPNARTTRLELRTPRRIESRKREKFAFAFASPLVCVFLASFLRAFLRSLPYLSSFPSFSCVGPLCCFCRCPLHFK